MLQSAYPLRLPTRPAQLWRVVVLGMTAGALLARVWNWLEGDELRIVPTPFILSLAVPTVLLMYLGFPARAGAQGMKLFDAFGWPRRVAWAQMVAVERARWPYLLFAPSLRVRLADGRTRWLPRETKRLDELHALALAEAGPTHPLVRALETPLYRL